MQIKIDVPKAVPYPPSVRKRIVGTLAARQNCAVATGLKCSLDLHPKTPPQVGRDRRGREFIMVKLASGERLQWFDENVPAIVKKAVEANDAGRAFRKFSFILDTETAIATSAAETRKRAPAIHKSSSVSSPRPRNFGRQSVSNLVPNGGGA